LIALLLRFLNPHISLPFSNLCIGLRSTNVLNKLLSPTYKVLTTSQPPSYLHNLISSTLSQYPLLPFRAHHTISSLKITDRSFRYASLRIWNQLPDSFHQLILSRFTSFINPFFVIITTLNIHYSFTLPIQAQNLPFQQILPTLINFW